MEKKSNKYTQHSAVKSILLHLIPGIFIIAGIFIFSLPLFTAILGVDPALGPIVGFILSVFFILIPIQLGILLYEGKRVNGKLSFKNVIYYTEKSPIKDYIILIPIIIVFSIFLFGVVSPIINPFFVNIFFAWYPQEYNFQKLLSNPTVLSGYKGVQLVFILYIIFGCILGPLVEELYFRGYLLPRMEDYAHKWAPAINTVLFSLYHFFSPWENLIRITAVLPFVYVVWRKKNIRFGIIIHIIINTMGGIMILIVIS